MKKTLIYMSAVAIFGLITFAIVFATNNITILKNQIAQLQQQTPQAMLESVRSEHTALSGEVAQIDKQLVELEAQKDKKTQAMKDLENKSHNLQAVLATGTVGN